MSFFLSLLYDVAYIRAANISYIFVVFIVSGMFTESMVFDKTHMTSVIVSTCASRHSLNEINLSWRGAGGMRRDEVCDWYDTFSEHLVNKSSFEGPLLRLYII